MSLILGIEDDLKELRRRVEALDPFYLRRPFNPYERHYGFYWEYNGSKIVPGDGPYGWEIVTDYDIESGEAKVSA